MSPMGVLLSIVYCHLFSTKPTALLLLFSNLCYGIPDCNFRYTFSTLDELTVCTLHSKVSLFDDTMSEIVSTLFAHTNCTKHQTHWAANSRLSIVWRHDNRKMNIHSGYARWDYSKWWHSNEAFFVEIHGKLVGVVSLPPILYHGNYFARSVRRTESRYYFL